MEFKQTLDKYREVVNKKLEIFFDDKINEVNDDFLKENYSHLKEFTLRPGKRIRPITSIMAFKSINGSNEEKIYPVSIVSELIHASSLIHDDLMDEDLLRRHKPTMHKIFEDYYKKNIADIRLGRELFETNSKRFAMSMAILQGNILYSLSNACILESDLSEKLKNKALNIFDSSYRAMNKGQGFDILISARRASSEEEYTKTAINKTGALLSASIRFGAMLNNASASQLEYLDKFAVSSALAFQIHDDIMDLSENMKKGRALGTDLRKGNNTLLVIRALQRGDEEQKQFLLSVIGNEKASDDNIKEAIGIIKKTGAFEYANNYANDKIKEAKEFLSKAGLNEESFGFFNNLADYVISRNI